MNITTGLVFNNLIAVLENKARVPWERVTDDPELKLDKIRALVNVIRFSQDIEKRKKNDR